MDDSLIRLIVAALATWRMAAWLWYEHGGECARAWLCRWPWAARQVECFWCVTFWMGLLAAFVAWLWWVALIPLALSGAAILLSGGGRVIWREMVDDGKS